MAKTKQEINQEIMERLEHGVRDMFSSEKFQTWLDVASKFTNYSWSNSMLIMLQNPEASRVAGYRTWQSLGRQVNKGEKGIQILAPLVGKSKRTKQLDDGTEEEVTRQFIYGFKYVNVFDVAQTTGKDLPTLVEVITTDTKGAYVKKLERIATEEGITYNYVKGTKSYGSYTPATRTIEIKATIAKDHQVKTWIHELAHHYTHTASQNYSAGEVIAESVAYVVANHIGLDTSNYSFGYVASWSLGKDTTILKSVADTIQKTAKLLIDKLEAKEPKQAKTA